jgi:hypothetical protein
MEPDELYMNIGGSYVAILRSDPDNGLLIVNWRRCCIVAVCAFTFMFPANDTYFHNERSCHLLPISYS